MKTIILPSHIKADLNWGASLKEAASAEGPILWEFDFGFLEGVAKPQFGPKSALFGQDLDSAQIVYSPLSMSMCAETGPVQKSSNLASKASCATPSLDPHFPWEDTGVFFSLTLALEEFVRSVLPEFREKTLGTLLFRGSIEIFEVLGKGDALAGADFLADYLHRLASFLPDEVSAYCFFEGGNIYSVGKRAQLLSKDRFWHVHLSLEEALIPSLGVLLPEDAFCSPSVLEALTDILEGLEPGTYQVIPEVRLTEMWQGLDTLIVIEEGVSHQGRRKLQGFEAAGGEVRKVRSRGIRTPDPLLPKQLR